jgi:hypothetical protein
VILLLGIAGLAVVLVLCWAEDLSHREAKKRKELEEKERIAEEKERLWRERELFKWELRQRKGKL